MGLGAIIGGIGKAIGTATSFKNLMGLGNSNWEEQMEQQTGEIVVKRRLAPNDPVYQNYINKLGIKNQVNIPNSLDGSGLETDREQGELANDSVVRDGGYLATQYDNGNIWEVITIPAPQFYHASYEITFWTQYTTHMNQLIEQLMSAYLPQGNCFKITTPKGYWFVAKDGPAESFLIGYWFINNKTM